MNKSEKVLIFCALTGLILVIIGISYFLFYPNADLSFLKGANRDVKAYQQIKVLYDMGEQDKTINKISEFVVDYPESAYKNKINIIAASLFYDRKNYEMAREYCIKVLTDPRTENTDYVNAVGILGKIIRDYEVFDPVSVNYLENAYLKAEKSKQGEIAGYLGYAYFYKKDYATALRYFNEATGELSIIGRERVYIEGGKYAEAIQEYINFFNLYPKSQYLENVKIAFFKQSFYFAQKLKEVKFYQKALDYLMNMIQLFPRDDASDKALVEAAKIYALNKDTKNALSFFEKALNNGPTTYDDEAAFEKGRFLYDTGKKKEALKLFMEFPNQYPKSSLINKAAEWADLVKKDLEN